MSPTTKYTVATGRECKKIENIGRQKKQITIFLYFSLLCGSGGSKTKLIKIRGMEIFGKIRNKKLDGIVARNISLS